MARVKDWLKGNWHWILLVVLAIGYVNQWTANQNAEAIQEARLEAQRAQQEKAEIETRVAELRQEVQGHEQQVTALQAERDQALAAIESHREQIEILRAEQEERELSVRQLRTEDELVQRYQAAYPEVSRAAGLGLMDLEANGITVPYLAIPAWFAETHIIEHDRLQASQDEIAEWEDIADEYGDAVAVSRTIEQLQREITAMERAATERYREGYEAAGKRYRDLNEKYIAELKKPRFDFGGLGTTVLTCGAAGAAGVYFGGRF